MSSFLLCFQKWLLAVAVAPFLSILKNSERLNLINIKTNSISNEKSDKKLSNGDIKLVIERLGLSYELDRNNKVEEEEDDDDDDSMGADEFAKMFDEEEPRLEEVKEAFNVFDENKDGFIDATELQRVLRCLGMEERLVKVEECKRMIRVADEDEDGRIDFNEFLKFMETSFDS